MDKITYVESAWGVVVKLGGRTVGRIVEYQGGYQYRTRGRILMKSDAEVFSTLAACKQSLEAQ